MFQSKLNEMHDVQNDGENFLESEVAGVRQFGKEADEWKGDGRRERGVGVMCHVDGHAMVYDMDRMESACSK